MSHFLKHTSCNNCGSSDARALYSDGGSHCFSCGYHPKTSVQIAIRDSSPKSEKKIVVLPDDATKEYGIDALNWTNKYGITIEELLRNDILYSYNRRQLIFSWYDDTGALLAYQARNLNTNSKRKYFTQGNINDLLPIYHYSSSSVYLGNRGDGGRLRRLVLTEDCLSAIKTARHCDSMPCLGSDINRAKLLRLRPFYDVLDVWLDPDKWHNAQKIVKRAQLLGFEASATWLDKDPKEHSDVEIKNLLGIDKH